MGSSARGERDADDVAATIHVTRRTNVHRRHAAARERITPTCGRPEIGGRAGLCTGAVLSHRPTDVFERSGQPAVTSLLQSVAPRCETATTHNARHQRAPDSRCFSVNVPRVRESVVARSGDFPVEFDDGDGLKNRIEADSRWPFGESTRGPLESWLDDPYDADFSRPRTGGTPVGATRGRYPA